MVDCQAVLGEYVNRESFYRLTTMDNEILRAAERMNRPFTYNDLLGELARVDWCARESSVERCVRRLAEYKLLFRVSRGVYSYNEF